MAKSKFIGGFTAENPVNLWLGVSLDNTKLQGDSLAIFANLVKRHSTKIKKLYIVVGCEIYGHYVGKENARLMGDEWVAQASDFFNEYNMIMSMRLIFAR